MENKNDMAVAEVKLGLPSNTLKRPTRKEMISAIKEALCWLDPNCNLDGEAKSEDCSDRENMIITLYEIIDRTEIKNHDDLLAL